MGWLDTNTKIYNGQDPDNTKCYIFPMIFLLQKIVRGKWAYPGDEFTTYYEFNLNSFEILIFS